MDNKIFSLLILLIVTSAGVVYWQLVSRPAPEPIPFGSKAPLVQALPRPESLGAQIYAQAKNPIENKVPEAPSPAVNPIEDVYVNPFE